MSHSQGQWVTADCDLDLQLEPQLENMRPNGLSKATRKVLKSKGLLNFEKYI